MYETQQVFKITLNRELNTKRTRQNSIPSTNHESQFRNKQNLHSAPKQTPTQYRSSEQLTICTVITKKRFILLNHLHS
jgi:hypothetical protein